MTLSTLPKFSITPTTRKFSNRLPMSPPEAKQYLARLHADWALNDDATEIRRDFKFKGFNKTMGFVVDAVSDVYNIDHDQVRPAPELDASVETRSILAWPEQAWLLDRLVRHAVSLASG